MKSIDYKEIQRLEQEGTPILCIDVRDGYRQHNFDAGAWKIPYNEIVKNVGKLAPYKETLTVVCCMSDKAGRTTKAGEALKKLGFTDVRKLEGGMMAGWVMKVKIGQKLPAPKPQK